MCKTSLIHRMKNLMLPIALPLILASCGDEVEGRIDIDDSLPAQVTNVAYTSGPGEIYLSWDVPSSPSFMYNKVTYRNAKGEEVYRMFSKEAADANGRITATITGFATVDPVEFKIYACNVRYGSAEPQVISAVPGAPAFLAVANSLQAEPAYGGVRVKYANDTQATVYVNVDYSSKSDPSKSGSTSFVVNGNSNGSRVIVLSTGANEFINGEDAVLKLTARDSENNMADPVSAESYVKKVKLIDRSGWSVPGYTDDAYGPTPGFSSQEAGGEGAAPNGRVMAMFDGNENTFWHTAWKQSSSYPHFFVVDMGANHDVACISVRRRTNNNGTNVGHTIYTCPASGANGDDTNAWAWEDYGWSAFNRESNDHQFYGVNSTSSRYIKMYYAMTDKGGDFVMVSEFNAYEPAE